MVAMEPKNRRAGITYGSPRKVPPRGTRLSYGLKTRPDDAPGKSQGRMQAPIMPTNGAKAP